MNTRTIKTKAAGFTSIIALCMGVILTTLVGCKAPDTGAGKPDAQQLAHYNMLKSAIETQSKTDALAALALLNKDIYRWQEWAPIYEKAMYDQMSITEAVEKEDWDLVNERFAVLNAEYGHL